MHPCPACGGPLEANFGTLFCPSCKVALQPRGDFAAALGATVGKVDPQVDRPIERLGACPSCGRGELQAARLAGERLAQCSECRALWLGGAVLARLRMTLSRPASTVRAPQTRADNELASSRFEFDDPSVNAIALPAALACGVLAQLFGFEIFVHATTGMWAHELGHAVMAWLSGFVAVPLPFLTLRASEDRSSFAIAVVTIAIAIAGFYAFRRRAWASLTVLAALAAVQVFLTVATNPAQAAKWVIFAGLGGELVLPTLCIAAFYQRLPGRWDFWRYPVLVASAVTLVRGVVLWTRVASGTRPMPHGSMVGSDAEGDVERLVGFYRWPEPSLAHTYLVLAWACLVLLACVYLFYVLNRKGSSVESAPGD